MTEALSSEAQAAVDKVEKLLRLAAKNPNEAEAASATAKAMDLLAAFNLDLGAVERHSGDSGKRAAEELAGGKHEWEQDLWRAVCQLNFCLYWNQIVFVPMPGGKIVKWVANDMTLEQSRALGRDSWSNKKRITGIQVHQHKIVGRTVNIAATKAMASYLQSVVDRLTKERCRPSGIRINSRWATSYREGVTARVVEKVWEKRRAILDEETNARMAAEKAARARGMEGVSTATALTISSFSQSEVDANIDFEYGAGTAAEVHAKRARKAAADKAAEEEYTRWAAANPKEAAKEEARRQKAREREERKAATGAKGYKGDAAAFLDGYDKGDEISLNQQAEGFKPAGLI